MLRYEAVVVAEMPKNVKEVLKNSGLDENVVTGLLTLEREHDPRYRIGEAEESGSFILVSSYASSLSVA